MFVYRDAFAVIGEQWFRSTRDGTADVDLVLFRQSPEPRAGVACEPFATRTIDLRKTEDEIWSGNHNTNRRLIRRAKERDRYACALFGPSVIDQSMIDGFVDFYDRFAAHRHLPRLRRNKYFSYARNGALYLSHVHLPGGAPACWHSFILQGGRARLLHSASAWEQRADPDRAAMIGRANRLLHWQEMVEFRNLGAETYDFGGWYLGDADQDKLAINYFKGQFGGDIVNSFNFAVPENLTGRAYSVMRKSYLTWTDRKWRHSALA